MKKYFATVAGMAFVALIFSGNALAQENFTSRFRADVPFNFQAGTKELAAGEYTFAVDPMNDAVRIRQRSTELTMYFSGMPDDPVANGKPTLTFTKNGDAYQLMQIQGTNIGVELVPAPEVKYELGAVIPASQSAGTPETH
jgi:hypothetical protein